MAYNRHFTQYINIALQHPGYNQGPTTEPNKERQPLMLDPRSPRLGSSTDRPERKQHNEHDLHRAPLELGCVTCTGIIGTCNCLEVSVSHEDSAISHPRDQDYLSLWVGKGMRWSCSKRLAYLVAKHTQMRARREGKARSRNCDQFTQGGRDNTSTCATWLHEL